MLYFLIYRMKWLEPPYDKTNKVTVRPVKTQISMGIRPVWSESLLCTQWVAKDPSSNLLDKFFHYFRAGPKLIDVTDVHFQVHVLRFCTKSYKDDPNDLCRVMRICVPSIPSWQILTAHPQPFRGARDLVFCLKVPLDSLLVWLWASSGGFGETARMRRLALNFAARIGNKYQIRLTRLI